MSVTPTMVPNKFTPSGNPINWSFSSNRPTIAYFEAKVYEAVSNGLISTLKFYTTPDNVNGTTMNLSRILQSYVRPEFKGYGTNFVDSFEKPIVKYYLVVTEKYISGEEIVTGDSYTTPSYYAFLAGFDRMSFRFYRQRQYLVATGKIINFLTTKPDKGFVNLYSDEGLYFIQENFTGLKASYSFYDGNNIEILTKTSDVTFTSTRNLFRINCSPAFLQEWIAELDFNQVSYYKVYLTDTEGNRLSEVRTFNYRDIKCSEEPVNIYWQNKYGGVDTYQFINPIPEQSVTKVMVKKNPYKVNNTGTIIDFDNSVFNIVDEVLNSTGEKKITVSTRILSDNETNWLSSLILSKNVWMKADAGLFIPVTVNETVYSAGKKKYIDGINTKQFTFKLSEGFDVDYRILPTTSTPAIIEGAEGDFYIA